MFQLWLEAQPDASYDQLIKALHEVGCERVANSLCNKHGMTSNEKLLVSSYILQLSDILTSLKEFKHR